MIQSFIKKNMSPAKILVLSFFSVITVGALLLKLPFSTTSSISWIDAFFTATSAVCVTGLTTLDTSSAFTLFGQIIILFLIQIGGLGIMTFSAFFIWFVRQKLSLSDRLYIEYSFLQGETRFQLREFLVFLIKVTFFIEFLGAVGFFFSFNEEFLLRKIWFAIFHSVSAFCNAGFSLYPDSFVRYKSSIPVNIIASLLIISGGIGFLVIYEIRNKFKILIGLKKKIYQRPIFSLHSWIVLYTTLFLIVGGTILIYLVQYFSGSSITLLESFFQSVTARTAGFNTVDIASLSNGTIMIIMILMFIGGSPGSTAGGIKTTTFAVFIFILAMSRNHFEDVIARNRTLPKPIVFQALLTLLFSFIVVFSSILFLTIIDPATNFLSLAFETVSAFGTVGLSINLTPSLNELSKIVIILTMFIGRIGSLTLFSLFLERKPEKVKYAEERILIG